MFACKKIDVKTLIFISLLTCQKDIKQVMSHVLLECKFLFHSDVIKTQFIALSFRNSNQTVPEKKIIQRAIAGLK